MARLAMTESYEYRIVYQREGQKKIYTMFQRMGMVMRFIEEMRKAPADLPPLISFGVYMRPVGEWARISGKNLSEGTGMINEGKVTT